MTNLMDSMLLRIVKSLLIKKIDLYIVLRLNFQFGIGELDSGAIFTNISKIHRVSYENFNQIETASM